VSGYRENQRPGCVIDHINPLEWGAGRGRIVVNNRRELLRTVDGVLSPGLERKSTGDAPAPRRALPSLDSPPFSSADRGYGGSPDIGAAATCTRL
jgi:hypothetical protein